MCGGTAAEGGEGQVLRGLSPRVRGNLAGCPVSFRCEGSIPACAGEPYLVNAANADAGVYPRVCGGTLPSTTRRIATVGLSPRVRGNPEGVRQ